jgi:hypothetical protein
MRAVRIVSKAANFYPAIVFTGVLATKLAIMDFICKVNLGKFSLKSGDVRNHLESSNLKICSKDRIC